MVKSSAWEANFACKQQSYYGEEDGEDKQHVRGADHRVVGQLVRLASHLIYIEAYGEDERRHAEQDHWKERSEREKKLVHCTTILVILHGHTTSFTVSMLLKLQTKLDEIKYGHMTSA